MSLGLDGPVRLLRNRTQGAGPRGHWLIVRLAGRAPNRDGLGARVELRWRVGEEVLERTREIRTAGGFQSAVPAEAHFGLGPLEAGQRLERVVVHWPGGGRSLLENVECDRVLVVSEPPPVDGQGDGR